MPLSSLTRILIAALLLCSFMTAGCGARLAKSLLELSRLQAAIAREYSEPNVNVNLNNSRLLTVTFINSSLNEGSPEERAKRAEQTAVFVRGHYSGVNQLAEIWVGFLRQKTRFVFAHYSEALGFFGFDKDARPLQYSNEDLRADMSVADPRLTAIYNANADQTEVRVTSLQLSGNINQGMAVIPHFTVPGDATVARRSAAMPKSVAFDFGSYSEKSLFPGAPRISFLVDGKVVFETTAQFSTSKSQDGVFSEFLQLEIPYPTFRRLAAGKTVVFKLGDFEYELTEEQRLALRGMTEYVSP